MIMRKLLIASVLALVWPAGSVSAQSGNYSNLFQNGVSNTAAIDQTGGIGIASNSSRVYQGDIYFNDGAPSNSSVVQVTQIGGTNTGITSEIYQNGTGQRATVFQDARNGGSQESVIWQFQGSGNSATVTQVGAHPADYQQSFVKQTGNGQVTVFQYGPADYSYVTQTGGGNSGEGWVGWEGAAGWRTLGVTVNQGGSSANSSSVTQEAYNSSVGVAQNGTGGINWSEAYQTAGSNNNIQISQTGSGGSNWSSISQGGGNWNGIYLSQTAVTGLSNSSGIVQNGSADWALVEQEGSGGSNTSQLNQLSGDYNTAIINQKANGGINWSSIDQGGGNSNYIYMSQTAVFGQTNTSYITQNGSNNRITVIQR
jgi:hypothetical protein